MTLTERDMDLLTTLTLRVRIMTPRQIASVWWPDGRSLCQTVRRLQKFQHAGLVEQHIVNAHPLLPATRPLFAWRPGTPEPDCERVAERCRVRWNRPRRPLAVCVASRKAAGMFGSSGRGLPPNEHRDHDLRLASVYVSYRQHRRQLARLWVGEHGLPKAGYRIKDPDAFLVESDGTVRRVIESAGRYSARQVESFHEHCVEHELPYVLW